MRKSLELKPLRFILPEAPSLHFNFLTCHGFKRTIPFQYYSQIFDSYIWSSVLLNVVVVSLILLVLGTFTSKRSQLLNCIGSKTVFYSISVILENGFESISANILKSRVYRISYFILAIISLVIGNHYKAIFTMDITAPIPEQIQVQKISELKNWTLVLNPRIDLLKSNDSVYFRHYPSISMENPNISKKLGISFLQPGKLAEDRINALMEHSELGLEIVRIYRS